MRRLSWLLALLLLVLSWDVQGQVRHAGGLWLNLDHPLARDLTGWWAAVPHLVSGRTWWDIGPYGADATLVGTPLWTGEPTQRFAGMLALTGTQYATVPHSGPVNYASSDLLSLVCWFQTTSAARGDLMVKAADTSPYTGYWLQMDTGGKLFFYLSDENGGAGGDSGILTTATYNDGRVHQVVATYAGTSSEAGMKLYVDGTLAAVTSAGSAASFGGSILNSQPFRLGANASNTSNFVGRLTNAMLYNRVLTAADVQALSQMQAPTYGGLVRTEDFALSQAGPPPIRRKVTSQ